MLNIPRFRTASGQRTFFYRAVTLWNSLSHDLLNFVDRLMCLNAALGLASHVTLALNVIALF